MKIITLKGKSNSGKTTAITNIFEKLKELDTVVQFFERIGADKKDFMALITLNRKKIALCSIGDIADKGHSPIEYIMNGINFAYERNADIFINAFSEDTLPVTFETYKLFFYGEDSTKPLPMSIQKSQSEYETQKNKITEEILNEIN